MVKFGMNKPSRIAAEAPEQTPGISEGNNTPKHMPIQAAPIARMWSATVARGMPTAENNGSRKQNEKHAPRRAESMPE
jgi:hypothetical protein